MILNLWMKKSRGKSTHRSEGFVTSLESKTIFDFIVKELRIFRHICVALDTSITDGLDHLNAVIASINASCELESTCEQAIFQSLWAVFTGLSSFPQLEINADRRAKSPIACVTVKVRKPTSLIGMPAINAESDTIGSACETKAL